MGEKIHRLILMRLAIAWLILSPLIAGLVFYLELRRVDSEVLDFIYSDARFSQEEIEGLIRHDLTTLGHLQHKAFAMTDQHFVAVDIYDDQQLHVAVAVSAEADTVREVIESRHHKFPFNHKLQYERFYLEGRLYMQALLPLSSASGKLAGYVEGIYRVDDKTFNQIKSRVYQSIIVGLVVVFVTVAWLYPVIWYLNRKLIDFSREVFKANVELIEVMGSAIAQRDRTTDSHNYRVSLYALRFGEKLNLPNEQLRNLVAGAFLHDVGKIGVRDKILGKEGKLTDEEMLLMKKHVVIGIDIIKKAKWLAGARDVIEYHHEKYDGTGYSRGLKGDEIPLNARIFAIVDVFDALMSERPYKRAFDLDDALAMMRDGRGKHFDPELLDKFFSVAKELSASVGLATYSTLTRTLSLAIRKYFFEVHV